MAGDEKKGEEEGDPRIAYVLRQIATSFRSITPENYEKFRKDPVAQELIEAFVHAYEGGPSALYVVENRGGLRLSAAPPAARSDKEKGKDDAGFLYILKLGAAATALSRPSRTKVPNVEFLALSLPLMVEHRRRGR